MSARWAIKRIEIRKTHTSFWHKQYSAAGKYGSGAIMNRMADKIREKGNKIFLNYQVSGFKYENNKIKKIYFLMEPKLMQKQNYNFYFTNLKNNRIFRFQK